MSDRAKITGAEPQLFVQDLAKVSAFYVEKLGFSIAFSHGEPAFYAQVVRDGARLNLRRLDAPAIDPNLRDQDQLLSATVTLEDADALFREYTSADVDFAQTLRDEPWGARTFIVRDPEGNLLLFAGPGQ